mmetsp:Transcript_9373/g.21244  ORF Transcript_9373/g.21244 Transcript_9373/m.21244 type:complete len:939 (+) Transcript_9373:73-2889(+)
MSQTSVLSADSKSSTHSAVLRLTLPSEEGDESETASGVQAPKPGHLEGNNVGKKKRRKVRRKSTRDRPVVGFGYLSPGKLGALLSEEETRAPLHLNRDVASGQAKRSDDVISPARKRQRLTPSIACELNSCNDPDDSIAVAVAPETGTGKGQSRSAEKEGGISPEPSGFRDEDADGVAIRSASAPRESRQKVFKSSTRTLRLVEERQPSTSQIGAGSNTTDMTIGEWSGEWTPKKKVPTSPQEKKTPIAQYDFDSSVGCLLAGGTVAGPLDPRDEEGHLEDLAGCRPGSSSGCADPTDHELRLRRTRVKRAVPMESSHDEGAVLGRPHERFARCEGSEQQEKMHTNRSSLEVIDLTSAGPTDHESKVTHSDSEELSVQASNAASAAGMLANGDRSKRRYRLRPVIQEANEVNGSKGQGQSAVQFDAGSDFDPWKDWREDAMTSELVGPLANAEAAGRFGMKPEDYERLLQAIFAGSRTSGFRRDGTQAGNWLDLNNDDFVEDVSAAPKYTSPISPKEFSVSEYCDATDYIIYMALSEKRPSTFQDCLDRACLNCHERFVQDYLAPAGARHIPLATVHLTPEQVRGLRFVGGFKPMFLRFVTGWFEDDEESIRSTHRCSLRLDEESQAKLRDLLSMIDGLPPCDEDEVHCDHLPLFAALGSRDSNPPYDVYEEFRNLRRRSYGFFCAYGASVRIKEADAEFDNCNVLRNAGDAVRNRKRDVDVVEAPPGFRGKSSFRSSSYPLSIVSWNLAGIKSSAALPFSEREARKRNAPGLIRDACLRREYCSGNDRQDKHYLPDIIALQEANHVCFGTQTFGESGYKSLSSTSGQNVCCDILIRKDFEATTISIPSPCERGRAAAALVTLPNGTEMAVCSVHLKAGSGDNLYQRTMQLSSLTSFFATKFRNIVLIVSEQSPNTFQLALQIYDPFARLLGGFQLQR